MFGYAITFQHSAEGDVSGWNLSRKYSVINHLILFTHLGWNELKSTHPCKEVMCILFIHIKQKCQEYVVAYAGYGTKIPESFNTEVYRYPVSS